MWLKGKIQLIDMLRRIKIEHLISVYMPVSIMRLRCHDLLKMTKYMFGALTKHFVKAYTCCLLRHRKVNSIKLKRDG